ncbi:hypothetical protein [Cupriavidus sp. CP313]
MSDGSIDQAFRDDIKAGGLLSGGVWNGAYYYEGRVDAPPRWGASLNRDAGAEFALDSAVPGTDCTGAATTPFEGEADIKLNDRLPDCVLLVFQNPSPQDISRANVNNCHEQRSGPNRSRNPGAAQHWTRIPD